jgi:hypothetical protein
MPGRAALRPYKIMSNTMRAATGGRPYKDPGQA